MVALGGWAPCCSAVLALLTGPFGSADHTNYAAYGRIAAHGGDPYLTPPERLVAPPTRSPAPSSRRGPTRSASTARSPRCCRRSPPTSAATTCARPSGSGRSWSCSPGWPCGSCCCAPGRRPGAGSTRCGRSTRSSSASASSAPTSTSSRRRWRWPRWCWRPAARWPPVRSPGWRCRTKVTYGVVGARRAARVVGRTSGRASSAGRRVRAGRARRRRARCTCGPGRTSSTSSTGPAARSRSPPRGGCSRGARAARSTSGHARDLVVACWRWSLFAGLRRRPAPGSPAAWRRRPRPGRRPAGRSCSAPPTRSRRPTRCRGTTCSPGRRCRCWRPSVLDLVLLLRLAAMAVAYVPGRVVGR